MPPRLITAAILAFWLAMTGLLIHHEVVPMMLADVAPTFQPDLTDEIGSPMVAWTVLHDGKRIGTATSKVIANEDRTYEFRSSAHFDQFKFGTPNQPIHVHSTESMYRVTEKGKLLAFAGKVGVSSGPQEAVPGAPAFLLGIEGEVTDGVCTPRVFFQAAELPLDKIDLPHQGSIVNPMHLLNRLRGLRAGQTWRIAMVDPLRIIANKLLGDILKGTTIPTLIAEVKTDTLTWDRKEVECFVIEYREPTKEVTARTWVRQRDGLVLQQEATHLGFEMITRRAPN